ncbi:Endo-1,4-beta-xylanase A precursor [compost metagenome]
MDDSFNDVTNHPWGRDFMDTLFSKGYMAPKTPYLFMPNDPISRGEFVTMLVKIYDIPLINQDTLESIAGNTTAPGTFYDVPRGYTDPLGLYDFLSIEAAARAGIVRGNSNATFSPRSEISRQDAAVMIARADKKLKIGTDDKKSLAALQKLFTDANLINIYALTSIEAISKAKIIEGKDNVLISGQKKVTQRFDPTESFTRAEAAAVAMRVLKQQNKIPK